MNQNEISAAVFYAKKHLDNVTAVEYAVLLAPVHESHRAAYSFVVEESGERTTAEAVTYNRDTAERIFNSLVHENVKACELEAFIRSMRE